MGLFRITRTAWDEFPNRFYPKLGAYRRAVPGTVPGKASTGEGGEGEAPDVSRAVLRPAQNAAGLPRKPLMVY